MNLYDRYNDLEDVRITLEGLISRLYDKELIDLFTGIKDEYKRELEEVEEIIAKEEKEEINYLNSEYERSKV